MSTWAGYIKEDMKARIALGQYAAEGLTLQNLAQAYQVSVTPVRAAVEQLVSEGLLIKQGNRRLSINHRRAGRLRSGLQRKRPQAPQDYYQQIRHRLIARSLCGEAIFVREQETAAEFGISQTAVRQAFNRLTGMGLLEHVPRRGWRLRPFRRRDFSDYLKVREVFELKALRLVWNRLNRADLQQIYDRNVMPRSGREWPMIDNSLHAYLVDKANNRYFRDFFERHGKYFDALIDWDGLDRDSAIETVRQHREIIDAILRRDRRAACKALAHHIRTNYGPLLDDTVSRRRGEKPAKAEKDRNS